MTTTRSIVVGIDVGGEKKGIHGVALCGGKFYGKFSICDPAEVAAWCNGVGAAAVGIDAPCKWSVTGRQRPCECHLAATGIQAFATPCLEVGRRNPFYGWMLNGAELFRMIGKRYELFDGRLLPERPYCFETFPHAIACALAGKTVSAKSKREDRPKLLAMAGVATEPLKNIDEVDAALYALTTQYFLNGKIKSYGDEHEGFIVVPSQPLSMSTDLHLSLSLQYRNERCQ
jgi:predicted nuclease with RNAse H fold